MNLASTPKTTLLKQGLNYPYRVTTRKAGNPIQPQAFCLNATQAWRAAADHAKELPGSITVIERKVDGAWVCTGTEIFNPQ
jgi:hypothetical protein